MAGTNLPLPKPEPARVTIAPLTLAVVTFILFAMAPPLCPAKQQAGGLARGQKHESRHEIDQLEDNWRDAVLKANTSVMAGLLADDYLAITPSGTLQTKDQTLANLRDGRMHFKTLEISDRKVRFYGTTALVTSVAEIVGSNADGAVAGSYRYTHVYIRNPQGSWKIVSFEASRMREPGDRADRKSSSGQN